MAVTSPDNLRSPDDGDGYALVQDLGAGQDSVQSALIKRANAYVGTTAERTAFTTAAEGVLWQDTNGEKFLWVRQAGSWSKVAGQKILASGNSYMTEGTSWNLLEPISSQPNGIVLIWSAYAVGGAGNQWSADFIPKQAIATIGGGFGWSFRPGLAGNVAKYLYISNGVINGYAANSTAPNNAQALRYVIGV